MRYRETIPGSLVHSSKPIKQFQTYCSMPLPIRPVPRRQGGPPIDSLWEILKARLISNLVIPYSKVVQFLPYAFCGGACRLQAADFLCNVNGCAILWTNHITPKTCSLQLAGSSGRGVLCWMLYCTVRAAPRCAAPRCTASLGVQQQYSTVRYRLSSRTVNLQPAAQPDQCRLSLHLQ